MAEPRFSGGWIYEAGIGENRAALIEGGTIVEAAIELPGGLRAGAVVAARLSRILIPGRRGIAVTGEGAEVLVEPLPAGLTEGGRFHVEILREVVPEPGRAKLPKGRAADGPAHPGPSLAERAGAAPAASPAFGPDPLEDAGWSELLEQALSGEIPFYGGALRMSLTPAMALFDVDGSLDPAALAVAGAAAAARAVRRFGIGGSIGIDLPTLAAKAERQAAAAAVDDMLPQPFERTAVNGFGFLQLVRRRARLSIPEILQADPAGAGARALLRRAERAGGSGPVTLHAAPAVIARIKENPQWLETLHTRTRRAVRLRAEPGCSILAAYVHDGID